jgi:hypothetical protein
MHQYATAFGWPQWPFRVTVDTTFARIWADRTALRQDVGRRLRRLKGLPHSSLQLMWADFGAGKSHTLRHIEYLCNADSPAVLIPVYTEVPVQVEGLEALYQRLSAALPPGTWSALASAAAASVHPFTNTLGARDLHQALQLIASKDPAASGVAWEWLQARKGTPHANTLRAYGIGSRIDAEDRVVDVITELVATLQRAIPGGSLVWLIDEYQRIADVTPRKRDAVARGMVSIFNACTSGLHLVLSFSVAQQTSVRGLIPPDLESRAATFPILALPFLSEADGVLFLEDLFAAFRSSENESAAFPFESAALAYIVARAMELTAHRLTPRKLMEYAGSLLFDIHERTEGQPTLPISVGEVMVALETPSAS